MAPRFCIEKIEGRENYGPDLAHQLFIFDQHYFPTPWDQASWAHLFLERTYFLLLLKNDSALLGFCLFEQVSADSFAHLLKLIVHPSERGRGLGKKLLEEAMRYLQSQHYSHFFLEVEEANHSAIGTYRSVGFEVIHQKKDFYGVGRSAFIMTKNL